MPTRLPACLTLRLPAYLFLCFSAFLSAYWSLCVLSACFSSSLLPFPFPSLSLFRPLFPFLLTISQHLFPYFKHFLSSLSYFLPPFHYFFPTPPYPFFILSISSLVSSYFLPISRLWNNLSLSAFPYIYDLNPFEGGFKTFQAKTDHVLSSSEFGFLLFVLLSLQIYLAVKKNI